MDSASLGLEGGRKESINDTSKRGGSADLQRSKEKLYLSVLDQCPSKKMRSGILKSVKAFIICHK